MNLTGSKPLSEIDGQYIDTQELWDRRNELQDELETDDEAIDDGQREDTLPRDERKEIEDEIEALDKILDEIAGYSGNGRGDTTLIAEDAFVDYAKDFARDTGAVSDDIGWPHKHIDWKAAAEELQQDFTSIDINGTTYWYH